MAITLSANIGQAGSRFVAPLTGAAGIVRVVSGNATVGSAGLIIDMLPYGVTTVVLLDNTGLSAVSIFGENQTDAQSVALAGVAKGQTDAQQRAAITGAASMVAGLQAVGLSSVTPPVAGSGAVVPTLNIGQMGSRFSTPISGIATGDVARVIDGPGRIGAEGLIIDRLPFGVTNIVVRKVAANGSVSDATFPIFGIYQIDAASVSIAALATGMTDGQQRAAAGAAVSTFLGLQGLGLGVAEVVTPPAPGGATINPPYTQTQPAASQRYYQATADRPGAWSKGTGGDAADFMIDSATGIYSATSNLGDGTVQIVKTLPLIFTPTDGSGAVTQTVTVTLTTVAAPASVSESITSDFTGTAGAKLSTRPGWALFGTAPMDAEPLLNGSGQLGPNNVYDANGGVVAVLYSPVGTLANSETRTRLRVSPTTQANFSIYLAANGAGSGVLVNLQLGSDGTVNVQNGVYLRQAGVQGSNISPFGTSFVNKKPDNTVELVSNASADGNTLALSLIGSNTITGNVDLTGKTAGSKFGYSGDGPYGPPLRGPALIEAMSFVKAATTLEITNTPLYSASNVATFVLSWSGTKPTRLQHRLYDNDTGLPVTDWMTGDSTVIGTSSGTISYVATAPRGGNLVARFRPLNDIVVVAIAATPTAFLANVIPFQQGYNVRSANYYQPIPMLTNAGVYGEVHASDIALPTDGMDGFASVVSTPGTNFTGFTNGIDQIISQNTAAGTLRVKFNDGPSIVNRIITFTGTTPTKFEITRDGLGLIAPEWLAGMEGAEVIRDLDMTLQNVIPENLDVVRTRNTPADGFYRNDTGVGPNAPYQDRVRGMAAFAAYFAGFKTWWSVLDVDMTDAEITALATFARDNYPANKNIILQWGNELHWNTDFSGVRRVALDGLRNGHYGAATASAPQPGLVITGEGGGYPGTTATGPYASVKTTHAVAAGDYITCNVYSVGNVVYRAKQAAPVGTYVADGTVDGSGNVTSVSENAYFTKDLTKDLIETSRRWEAVRFNQIIEIYHTVFGAARFAAQIKPVIMGQAGGSLYGQLATTRTYVPGFFAKIWGVGNAFYFTSEDGYNSSTATAANLEASFRAQMPIVKAATIQTVIDALRMGKVPCFYEGRLHNNGLYGRAGSEAYTSAWDTWQSSTTGQTFNSDVAYFMKTTVPGVVAAYDLAAGGVWSIKKGWRDTANKQRLGWLDGLARTS